ncbi:MAG: hypothetical protein JWO63_3038 [Frankiales bacterium]|nr:hypothetical protein [Frankiales bacterium]
MIVFGLLSKAIFALGALVAVFVVVWYFYIHDHAARTEGSVAISLARAVPGGADAHCREHGQRWRCTVGARSFTVVRAKKNCWRVAGRDIQGCVQVIDFVRGLL